MNYELKLYRFAWDLEADGLVEGLFISTPVKIKTLYGKSLFIDSVFGQKACLTGVIEPEDIEEVQISLSSVVELKEVFGQTISGINPFEFLEEAETSQRMCCWYCGHPMIWGNDFSFEEVGYEEEGIMSTFSCSNCDSSAEFYLPLLCEED